LSSENMKKLINDLREKFDFILLDSPPVMSVTDAVVLAALVDGVVMVIRGAETPIPPIQRAIQQLSDVNVRILGTALNGIDFKKGGYYYQYYYKYYYGYGYGEEGKKHKSKTKM